ncbi:uncharacterized protein ZBAI_07209 [Zygosaccharomyces bailii ISA1307]|nr:uncharacterized protein ZBAI_07209 [Zygosaccharomyces bailii ISA1307]
MLPHVAVLWDSSTLGQAHSASYTHQSDICSTEFEHLGWLSHVTCLDEVSLVTEAERDKRQALQQQWATCPIFFCRLSVPPIQRASSASGARVATRPRALTFPRFSPSARLIKVFQCEAVVDNTLTAAER